MNGYRFAHLCADQCQGRTPLGQVSFQDAAGPQALHQCGRRTGHRQVAESYQEELFGCIEKGNFPKWNLRIQVMPELDAEKAAFNPFDLTKVWPHGDYPLIDVGRARAQPQSRTITSPKLSKRLSRRPTLFQASASRPTRFSRRASSPMRTRIAIASAPTTKRCR